MMEKILFVDDEQNILDGIRRRLRKTFPVETALGPVEGLQAVNKKGPFAVVVADLRMPVMDGIKFLIRLKERSPDSVRMILTGNADLQSAIKAVNEGHVFRFMTKPCPTDVLVKVLRNGIEQNRLLRSERELLEQTLKGSIDLLTEMLSMLNPEAFARASRVKRYASEIAFYNLGLTEIWKIQTSAMLSQIGLMTMPGLSLEKIYKGQDLTPEERNHFDRHPRVGFELLNRIPRMEEVAEIVRCQEQRLDQKDGSLPLEARILKVVLDFDLLLARGESRIEALNKLKRRQGWYDPAVLEALESNLARDERYELREVNIEDLRPKMIIKQDIRTIQGLLLIAGGQEAGPAIIRRLRNFKDSARDIPEPIKVLVPIEE
ncbi:MAG: response regulator [Desulfohalobiaceae bacterium]|nr:response regulator [Desulfohalobiaceae bacterium]